MFDVGFSELLVVGLVGLLVLGPERLPVAIRTGALWIGRLKRSFQIVKTEIEREIGADEIRRQLHNEEIMNSLESSRKQVEKLSSDTSTALSGQQSDIQRDMENSRKSVQNIIDAAKQASSASPAEKK